MLLKVYLFIFLNYLSFRFETAQQILSACTWNRVFSKLVLWWWKVLFGG